MRNFDLTPNCESARSKENWQRTLRRWRLWGHSTVVLRRWNAPNSSPLRMSSSPSRRGSPRWPGRSEPLPILKTLPARRPKRRRVQPLQKRRRNRNVLLKTASPSGIWFPVTIGSSRRDGTWARFKNCIRPCVPLGTRGVGRWRRASTSTTASNRVVRPCLLSRPFTGGKSGTTRKSFGDRTWWGFTSGSSGSTRW